MSGLLEHVGWKKGSSDEQQRRVVLLSVTIPTILVVVLWVGMGMMEYYSAIFFAACILFPSSIFTLCFMVLTKCAPGVLVEGLALAFTAAVIMGDWGMQGSVGMPRTWSACVVIMDILLLTNSNARSEFIVKIILTVYLTICAIEEGIRFGMLDLGFIPHDDLYYNCESPPCAVGMERSLAGLITSLSVFHIDYVLTRRFALQTRNDRQALNASIDTAQTIANHLAEFDLELAERAIGGTTQLPEGLRVAFTILLSHLKTYRPYLPESCLPVLCTEPQAASSDGTPNSSCTASLAVISTHATSPRALPEERRITLLAVNLKRLLDVEKRRRAAVVNCYLSRIMDCTRSCSGIVEWFNGDRVLVSFNAARRTMHHTECAVRCGLQIQRRWLEAKSPARELSVAAACGWAVCQDLGCLSLKRFCTLGRVASRVHLMERLHRMWGLPGVLCDKAIEEETSCFFDIYPLPGTVLFRKQDKGGEMWLALNRKQHISGMEWMYELQNGSSGPLDIYRSCMELVTAGECDRALAMSRSHHRSDDRSIARLFAFLEASVEAIQKRPDHLFTLVTGLGLYDVPVVSESVLMHMEQEDDSEEEEDLVVESVGTAVSFAAP